ncbi:hypothetical protein PCL_12699 [Purpureocillium lilacinum]|uniref:Uncharacterized protein n=1 Tax=Purpureocillium lilacinum TaxID=33203 RepID=A0A2U3E712_PURLI|nr:hypothetical protein PCL_12699 [Purpureocillium lilacinum]
MKASIVLFALVQGLALATPIQGGKAGEATDMNDPLIRDPHQPLPSKTAAGLPFTLREAKKWYDQHTLPDKCFEGKNKELCDRIYKFCLNILDPLYEDDIVTSAEGGGVTDGGRITRWHLHTPTPVVLGPFKGPPAADGGVRSAPGPGRARPPARRAALPLAAAARCCSPKTRRQSVCLSCDAREGDAEDLQVPTPAGREPPNDAAPQAIAAPTDRPQAAPSYAAPSDNGLARRRTGGRDGRWQPAYSLHNT